MKESKASYIYFLLDIPLSFFSSCAGTLPLPYNKLVDSVFPCVDIEPKFSLFSGKKEKAWVRGWGWVSSRRDHR